MKTKTAYRVNYLTYPSRRCMETKSCPMYLARTFRSLKSAERFLANGDLRCTDLPVEPFGEVETVTIPVYENGIERAEAIMENVARFRALPA